MEGLYGGDESSRKFGNRNHFIYDFWVSMRTLALIMNESTWRVLTRGVM